MNVNEKKLDGRFKPGVANLLCSRVKFGQIFIQRAFLFLRIQIGHFQTLFWNRHVRTFSEEKMNLYQKLCIVHFEKTQRAFQNCFKGKKMPAGSGLATPGLNHYRGVRISKLRTIIVHVCIQIYTYFEILSSL